MEVRKSGRKRLINEKITYSNHLNHPSELVDHFAIFIKNTKEIIYEPPLSS